ncbi:MAG: glycosyltransferase family 9 protein, partial [Omnitrophica WOR_2 bacterium]
MLAGQRALLPALAHKLALKPGKEFEREIQKIAVLRANNLGDFVLTLPALQALRRTFPQAEIVLLGQEWHSGFLKDRPAPVDRVVVVP